jgi:S-DNA-T family DNA segregation ATPase FtsK/SpoIIIE
MRASKAEPRPSPTPEPPASPWRWLLQREVWGLAFVAIGAMTIIALVSRSQGKLSEGWSLMLRQVFGLGAYPVALAFVALGIMLLFWHSLQTWLAPRWQGLVGLELLFFAGLGVLHVSSREPPLELAKAGKRGGYIGWALWQLTVPLLGKTLSVMLLAVLVICGLCLALGISWGDFTWRIRWVLARLGILLRGMIIKRQPPVAPVVPQRQPVSELPKWLPASASSPTVRAVVPKKARPGAAAPPAKPRRVEPTKPAPQPARRPKTEPARSPAGLPSLDLLGVDQPTTNDDADARMKAEIIENTLEAFGIPARVTEWHRGPVVTQFGVEPGYIEQQDRDGNIRRFKIRVSKILSLTSDLALALAASPIRIEAPVPGRAVVGIEVPNTAKSVVGLRGVLESTVFRKMRSRLRISLGRDVSGEAVVADLVGMPHLLLAGTTGSGKSVCLNAIIASLLFYNGPAQVNLLLVDPKRVELTKYNGIPHLIAPVVTDIEKVIVALRWVTREMEQRYEQFVQVGARNLEGFNKMAKGKGLETLPFIVVIIDELADLMLAAPEDVERTLCRLAQMARATGIHLVIATQRPSVDVVTGLIKANFPARISFAVTSQVDSRVILDTPGAEKLLGRGDMLFMAPDSPKLQRIQGCYVSDKELEGLIAFWRNQALQDPTRMAQPVPWEDMALAEGDPDDALLQQAAELVRQHRQASASFLQRQMRIGYPRAARLIDRLEQLGIIGPAEVGGRSRVVREMTDSAPDDRSSPAGGEPQET